MYELLSELTKRLFRSLDNGMTLVKAAISYDTNPKTI